MKFCSKCGKEIIDNKCSCSLDNELIDVLDENGKFLGYSVDRDEVHKQNLWHNHASAWIMNNEGKILLQQRALTKKKNPGVWAKTGGHVDAGETCEDAIKREIYEEIGLKVDDNKIYKMEVFKSTKPNEHYFSYGYVVLTNLKENDFILQKEEVNKVKYYDIEELEQLKRNNDENYSFSKWEDDDFFHQMDLLKEYRERLNKS